MAKSGMLSLESLPLHHAGNLPRALIFSVKCFRFTHFRKNASATPLVSHTFKTKDLKPFRFTHFQKKGGGWLPLSNPQPHTSNLCSSLTPLDSALTSKRAAKSFTCNTYEKTYRGGVALSNVRHPTSDLRSSLSPFAAPERI